MYIDKFIWNLYPFLSAYVHIYDIYICLNNLPIFAGYLKVFVTFYFNILSSI